MSSSVGIGFLQASPFVPGEPAPLSRRPQQAGSGQPWSGDRSPRTGSRAPLAAFTGVARRLPTPRENSRGRGPDRPALSGAMDRFYRSSATGAPHGVVRDEPARTPQVCRPKQHGAQPRGQAAVFSIAGSRSWRFRCRPNLSMPTAIRSGSCETPAAARPRRDPKPAGQSRL